MPKFVDQVLHKVARAVAAPVLEPGQEEVGLGDAIHGVTKRLGLKHCHKCAKRKAALNKRKVSGRPR